MDEKIKPLKYNFFLVSGIRKNKSAQIAVLKS